jgi:hypothetical protein
MRNVLLWSCATLGLLCAIPAAQDADCDASDALGTEIWQRFNGYVLATYNPQGMPDRNAAYVYGHAYGRLAMAVDGDRRRAVDFACVEEGLFQIFVLRPLVSGADPNDGMANFRRAMAAAFAHHDDVVAVLTGVTDTSPLYEVFGSGLGVDMFGTDSPMIAQTVSVAHPCERIAGDASGSDAVWTWYTSMGVGGTDFEVDGYICDGRIVYTFDGDAFRSFRCDDDWTCRPDDSFNATITHLTRQDDGAVDHHYRTGSGSTGWGRRLER